MAVSTFYPTSVPSGYENLLTWNSEVSWDVDGKGTGNTITRRISPIYIDPVGRANTIPYVADIERFRIAYQIKQSRDASSIFATTSDYLLYNPELFYSTSNSTRAGTTWLERYLNAVNNEDLKNTLHRTDWFMAIDVDYAGLSLSTTTQYLRNINAEVTWHPILISSISLNKTSLNLNETETEQLTASLSPSEVSYPNIVWSTTDGSVASVSSTGLVTAVGLGTCTIRCAADDRPSGNPYADCSITVLASQTNNIYLGNNTISKGIITNSTGTPTGLSKVIYVDNKQAEHTLL